ncbi:flagellar hook assembly protein FlgD [Desulfovibrio desulfuricans]|uniref:Basal-body rod modification protein FlgD n=1 Tax=Desulfovibrio desulfuricans TaxID=876 RepID=A0A4P7UHH4_DESDE|nr:flagellar hook assembly protein FlgD [Desulfovibrio desulfuricans]QCC85716.1 flagellar hook assembly protein FlgD [Desulfovibrio desulfuricans]
MSTSVASAITQANNEFNAVVGKQSGGANLDKNAFMLLLVTQFKYQDPLNPMDDKEFVSQMAQFSSLEQLMNLNTSMTSLTDATNNEQMINATSYIGKEVTVSGNSIGKVTDTTAKTMSITKFRYAPNDDVASGTLTVRDADNNVVYSQDVGSKAAGTTYEFDWNGMTSAGTVAPDGVYTVNLSLLSAKGEAVLADQVVNAKVTGVVNNNKTVYLGLDGGQLMELSKVRQVTVPTSTSTNTSTS